MRLTIKTKLMASFGALIVLLGGAGYAGISSLQSTNDRMTAFSQGPFVQVQEGLKIQSGVNDVRRVVARSIAVDTSENEKLAGVLDKDWTAIETALATMLQAMPEAARAKSADLAPLLADVEAASREAFAFSSKVDILISGTFLDASRDAQAVLMADLEDLKAKVVSENKPGAPAALAILMDLQQLTLRSRIQTVAAVSRTDLAKIRESVATVSSNQDTLREKLTTLAALPAMAAHADAFGKIGGHWDTYYTQLRTYLDLGLENNLNEALSTINERLVPIALKAEARINELNAEASALATSSVAESQTAYEATRMMLIAIVAGAVLIGIAAALWMSLSISRGLAKSVKLAEDIGAGDLTQTVEAKGQDEIGDLLRAMNLMTDKLREIVSDVTDSASQVAAGSQQSAATAEQLSQGATEQSASTEQLGQGVSEQASATEQASSAMEEMAANIRQNSENATTTEKIAAQASINAERSGKAVANSVEARRSPARPIFSP
ncbi:methyl-accepting chemotaxis protein [Aureimonas sp. Leaf427]|uniref:HAMP domain-containing methyl-accepting chemotaxis protein n=1 Tax=Aureimonas sp. Leaf427 TaxID=1736375 RepID=UPI00070CCA99|nr:methyl-accepting chemotaxis protein [Aureimonas sp. Leaf427]KQT69247.1 hypothetical protein ASG62_17595 [Aureimonas sp. Leaf427]